MAEHLEYCVTYSAFLPRQPIPNVTRFKSKYFVEELQMLHSHGINPIRMDLKNNCAYVWGAKYWDSGVARSMTISPWEQDYKSIIYSKEFCSWLKERNLIDESTYWYT